MLYNEFKNKPDKPIEYTVIAQNLIEIDTNITGRLYPSKADMIYHKTIYHHNKTKERLANYMQQVPVPQLRDFQSDIDKLYKDKNRVKEILDNKKSK